MRVSLVNRAATKLARRCWIGTKGIARTIGAIPDSTQERLHIFVAGAQRSGTNMLMETLDRSLDTDVYHETDSRAFEHYEMRDRQTIKRLAQRSNARCFVIKALCELDQLRSLMDNFAPSKAVWIVRNYEDCVNSALVSFKSLSQSVASLVRDRDGAGWRGRGMSDETHAVLREHYHDGINDASLVALFWYLRNILFFEQGLHGDRRTLLASYEAHGGCGADRDRFVDFAVPRRAAHGEGDGRGGRVLRGLRRHATARSRTA